MKQPKPSSRPKVVKVKAPEEPKLKEKSFGDWLMVGLAVVAEIMTKPEPIWLCRPCFKVHGGKITFALRTAGETLCEGCDGG